jgi:nicotinate-nucleotide adenylyltransferase
LNGAGWLKPPGPAARGLRIGLLGGSFNPPHEGHLHISDIALKRLGLDYVWWLVSPQNPLKSARDTAPLDSRVSLAARLVHKRRILVTDAERVLGTRFTIDTLKRLTRRFPEPKFVWLMGSDNLVSFDRWKGWPQIVALVPIAVVMRPGSMLAPLSAKAMQRFRCARKSVRGFVRAKPPALAVIGGPRNPQSSTAIRGASRNLVRPAPL